MCECLSVCVRERVVIHGPFFWCFNHFITEFFVKKINKVKDSVIFPFYF